MKRPEVTRSAYGAPWHKATRYSDLPEARPVTDCGIRTSVWWAFYPVDSLEKDAPRCTRCFKVNT